MVGRLFALVSASVEVMGETAKVMGDTQQNHAESCEFCRGLVADVRCYFLARMANRTSCVALIDENRVIVDGGVRKAVA